ncbi:hypothetical protein HMPREF9999_01082 [Alloprevotella sp. oral taxon 473 str. F0040]|nr:hypothetical protein HMPREF9999_01082 [Alloprevotella sp. oral taxon 473 str. F0040]
MSHKIKNKNIYTASKQRVNAQADIADTLQSYEKRMNIKRLYQQKPSISTENRTFAACKARQ